jgi:hypothetical protein
MNLGAASGGDRTLMFIHALRVIAGRQFGPFSDASAGIGSSSENYQRISADAAFMSHRMQPFVSGFPSPTAPIRFYSSWYVNS